MSATSLATTLRSLWRLAVGHGLDADAIFRDCGLNPLLMNEPWGRYMAEDVYRAYLEVSQQTGNPHIALEIPKYYQPLDLHYIGIGFLSSNTVLDGLQRLVRYRCIISSSMVNKLLDTGSRTDFLLETPATNKKYLSIIEDYRLAVTLTLCRAGLGGTLDPVEVAFTYPQPECTGEHFAFFRCPLKFSKPAARISFARSDIVKPLITSNRDMARNCDRELDEVLRNGSKSDLISKVKWAIIETLPSGAVTEAAIAKAVFMSSRTMHRKLAQEGTNYRALLTETRRDLSMQHIVDKNIPLSEVGYALGFSSLSSFSRAFKRWTGESPATYRNKNMAVSDN